MVRAPRQLDEPTGRDASVAVKNTVREAGDVDDNSMSKLKTGDVDALLLPLHSFTLLCRAGKVKPATVVFSLLLEY